MIYSKYFIRFFFFFLRKRISEKKYNYENFNVSETIIISVELAPGTTVIIWLDEGLCNLIWVLHDMACH